MTEEEVVTHILNPSGATANVDLLDRTVDSFYGAISNEQVGLIMHMMVMLHD